MDGWLGHVPLVYKEWKDDEKAASTPLYGLPEMNFKEDVDV